MRIKIILLILLFNFSYKKANSFEVIRIKELKTVLNLEKINEQVQILIYSKLFLYAVISIPTIFIFYKSYFYLKFEIEELIQNIKINFIVNFVKLILTKNKKLTDDQLKNKAFLLKLIREAVKEAEKTINNSNNSNDYDKKFLKLAGFVDSIRDSSLFKKIGSKNPHDNHFNNFENYTILEQKEFNFLKGKMLERILLKCKKLEKCTDKEKELRKKSKEEDIQILKLLKESKSIQENNQLLYFFIDVSDDTLEKIIKQI